MKSQQLRKLAPELDSLRLGSGWKIDELSKPQIIVESSYGHSHPGSAHLDKLVDEAGIGIKGDVPQTTSSLIFVMERRRDTMV